VARSVRLPGRLLEPGRDARPRGMTAALRGTETGLQYQQAKFRSTGLRPVFSRLQSRRRLV
jgi:hypothetical protein